MYQHSTHTAVSSQNDGNPKKSLKTLKKMNFLLEMFRIADFSAVRPKPKRNKKCNAHNKYEITIQFKYIQRTAPRHAKPHRILCIATL